MNDISLIINSIVDGDSGLIDDLFPLVYNQLHRIATHQISGESAGHTLSPTVLVHEAYLRLVGEGEKKRWKGRAIFYSAAAEAMRRILIDYARQKRSQKRGGNLQRTRLDTIELAHDSFHEELIAIDEVLDELATLDPQAADIVKMKFFSGYSVEEAADLLGISIRTAYRDWKYARAWLRRQIDREIEDRE